MCFQYDFSTDLFQLDRSLHQRRSMKQQYIYLRSLRMQNLSGTMRPLVCGVYLGHSLHQQPLKHAVWLSVSLRGCQRMCAVTLETNRGKRLMDQRPTQNLQILSSSFHRLMDWKNICQVRSLKMNLTENLICDILSHLPQV